MAVEFTMHNVVLPDGTQTFPQNPVIDQVPAVQGMLATALDMCPIEDPEHPPRLIDLGCLEGGHSAMYARAGYDVTGLEVRAKNVEACEYVREQLGLPNLRFVQDDVRNLADHGEFDVVHCAGLLYHMENPSELLALIGQQTRRLLILRTHYAPIDPKTTPFGNLGDWMLHEGRIGRTFFEFPEGTTAEQMQDLKWASWGNPASFWLERKQLMQAMQDAGFDLVYEQHDTRGDIANATFDDYQSLGVFIGVKSHAQIPRNVEPPKPLVAAAEG